MNFYLVLLVFLRLLRSDDSSDRSDELELEEECTGVTK